MESSGSFLPEGEPLMSFKTWIGNESDPIHIDVDKYGIYIHDQVGEIVGWNKFEWLEDEDLLPVVVNALIYAMEYGGGALRETINHPIQTEPVE
jgi:hypothetical protein